MKACLSNSNHWMNHLAYKINQRCLNTVHSKDSTTHKISCYAMSHPGIMNKGTIITSASSNAGNVRQGALHAIVQSEPGKGPVPPAWKSTSGTRKHRSTTSPRIRRRAGTVSPGTTRRKRSSGMSTRIGLRPGLTRGFTDRCTRQKRSGMGDGSRKSGRLWYESIGTHQNPGRLRSGS